MSTSLLISLLLLLLGIASQIRSADMVERSSLALDYSRTPKISPAVEKWTRGGYIRAATFEGTFYKLTSPESIEPPIHLVVPEARFTFVEDFDVAPNGSIVAVGFSESDEGRTQFLAIIPKSGPTRIVKTTPYWPLLVSVAPDGSIWTAGTESIYDSSGYAVSENWQANALRHFDASGTLIGAAITNRQAKGAQAGFLVAGPNRVSLYGPKGGKSQVYFEAAIDLTNLATYPGAPMANLALEQITGFAITDSGSVFVSTMVNDTSHAHALYQLDKNGKTWNRIAFPSTVVQSLVGNSGESLIFRAKASSVPTLKFFDFAAPDRSEPTGQQ